MVTLKQLCARFGNQGRVQFFFQGITERKHAFPWEAIMWDLIDQIDSSCVDADTVVACQEHADSLRMKLQCSQQPLVSTLGGITRYHEWGGRFLQHYSLIWLGMFWWKGFLLENAVLPTLKHFLWHCVGWGGYLAKIEVINLLYLSSVEWNLSHFEMPCLYLSNHVVAKWYVSFGLLKSILRPNCIWHFKMLLGVKKSRLRQCFLWLRLEICV